MPVDPLDALITEFVAAFGDRLTADQELRNRSAHIPRPDRANKAGRTRYLNERIAVYREMEPALTEIYERIATHGAAILKATADPNIVDPVENLLKLAMVEQSDLTKLMAQLPAAAQPLGGLALLVTGLAAGLRGLPRQGQIEAAITDLTAYYLMNLPPADDE